MNEAIIGAAALPANDLQIPSVMGAVMLITRGVGFGLFVLFFIAETLRLQAQATQYALAGGAKPALNKFVWRAVVLFVSMAFLYQWVFLKMVSLCDHISMLIANEEQWMQLVADLTQSSNMTVPFLHATVPTIIGAIALSALQYVEDIFVTIRFVLLCMLFAIGPIAWASSISELGAGAIRGWFKNTWHVSFWLVVFSIVKAAIIPLWVSTLSQGPVEGSVIAIIYALVILAAIFMIPSLTAAVFSETNIGAVAGAAISIATYTTMRAATASGGIVGQPQVASVLDAVRVAKQDGVAAAVKGIFTPRGGDGSQAGSSGGSTANRTR